MKPILFNTEMVKAILAGRKTVTRRAVKNIDGCTFQGMKDYGNDLRNAETCKRLWAMFSEYGRIGYQMVEAPYQPGDILWIRETWCALPVTPGGHMRGHDMY